MPDLLAPAGAALWLGILTSISPCPLATNIAAVSYMARHLDRPRRVLLAGLLYSAGRALTYVLIAALLVASLLSAPALSHALQKHMNRLLGPVLVVVGMLLLDLIRLPWAGTGTSERAGRRLAGAGLWGSGLLGMLFALSFCPVSAALFFGSLIPLSAQHRSIALLPGLYGLGTALPAVAFALLIAFATRRVGAAFARVAAVETWVRRITGAALVGIGVYLTLVHVFRVL